MPKKGNIPWNKGLKGAQVSGMKGKKHTEEAKRKNRDAHKGKVAWNKGKTGIYSKEVRDRISSSLKKNPVRYWKGKNNPHVTGEKCHLWRGGITPENHKIRSSLEYKLWRTAVFERDKYECIWCGLKSGNGRAVILHADHIKPFAYYPELRFAIDNGRTLCVECHKKTDTYAKKIKNI